MPSSSSAPPYTTIITSAGSTETSTYPWATVTVPILSADGYAGRAYYALRDIKTWGECCFDFTLTCTNTALCQGGGTSAFSKINVIAGYNQYTRTVDVHDVQSCVFHGTTAAACTSRLSGTVSTQTITAASDLHFAQVPITHAAIDTETLLMKWISSCYANGAGPFGTAGNFEATATSTVRLSSYSSRSSGQTSQSGSPTGRSSGQPSQSSSPTGQSSGQTSQSKSTGLSTGAEAGIGVGVGVGVLLLLALAFFAIRRRRNSKKQATKQHTESSAYEKDPNDEIQRPQELDPTARRGELPTGKEAHELAAKPKPGKERHEMDAQQLHELSSD